MVTGGSMKYIVKNCGCNPSCDECYNRCADISDCVIKRVIEKCKHFKSALDYDKGSVFVAQEILDMFEIKGVKE